MSQMKKNDIIFNEDAKNEKGDVNNREDVDSLEQQIEEYAIALSDLTEEEIDYICQQITPRRIRAYFKQYPKEFHKIRSGSRAESLSDDSVTMLVKKNISKSFIASFLRRHLSNYRLSES